MAASYGHEEISAGLSETFFENPRVPYASNSRFTLTQGGRSDADAKQSIIDAHAGPYME